MRTVGSLALATGAAMDWFEGLRKLIEWSATLPLLPKLVLTLTLLAVTIGTGLLFLLLVWTTPPGIVYDAAVIKLLKPTDDPIGALNNRFEPYPGFPYYSEASDHPSQWPPRIFKDRTEFTELIHELNSDQIKAELDRWPERLKTLHVAGRGVDPAAVEYSRLRLLLAENSDNYAAVSTKVGPQTTKVLQRLEERRQQIEETLPNRVLALRIENEKSVDAENFVVEINVAGAVYDVTLNLQGEAAKSQQWTPNRFTVEIPRLRPGYTADVQVWYQYQPLSEQVFPGRKDVEWDATEGVVINNLGISNERIRRDPHLLDDMQPYFRYQVDPVRGSPTFGRLATPAKAPDAMPPVSQRATAPKTLSASSGPQALLIAAKLFGERPTEAEGRRATEQVTQAVSSFSAALAQKVETAGGVWLFERLVPAQASYNPLARAYLLGGELLAILQVPDALDVVTLPGWSGLAAAGSASYDYQPWDQARYEAVLHFFADPADTNGDSKRLITQPLRLDEVFDVAKAKTGERNAPAPEFVNILEFSGTRIRDNYHVPYSLKTNDDPAPFYLVVRGQNVSENFYLPREWITLADAEVKSGLDGPATANRLSRLYDYAEPSRELSAAEFAAIFK